MDENLSNLRLFYALQIKSDAHFSKIIYYNHKVVIRPYVQWTSAHSKYDRYRIGREEDYIWRYTYAKI